MLREIKNIYHFFCAITAAMIYGFPSGKLTVIGVTGTDGKTTTASLLYHILKSARYNVSMISTVGALINGYTYDVGFHVTTPSPFDIQKFLKKAAVGMKKNEARYMIIETTSHAIDQHRVAGINFSYGVLTNVTHEHLDYHKTYERYVATKTKLLQKAKIAVINQDDSAFHLVKKFLKKSKEQVITYGISDLSEINSKNFPLKSSLIGEFNVYNILAAAAALQSIGLTFDQIQKALNSFSPPMGRQEIVYDKDFRVIIDFAHTPNAFAKLLPAIKKDTKGRIIHVFGSAGMRDKTKRPAMGKISSMYSDVIILTAEDPRNEEINSICKDIAGGFVKDIVVGNEEMMKKQKTYVVIPDRKKAIFQAITLAKKGDTVLLTGKSHEKSMNYGRGEIPWSEYSAVEEALEMRRK